MGILLGLGFFSLWISIWDFVLEVVEWGLFIGGIYVLTLNAAYQRYPRFKAQYNPKAVVQRTVLFLKKKLGLKIKGIQISADTKEEEAEDEPSGHLHLQITPSTALRSLDVRVVAAKDLVAVDNRSDPYVKLYYCGKKEKTKSKKRTLNPTWNETFKLASDSHVENVADTALYGTIDSHSIASVWDWNVTKNIFIGEVVIKVQDLEKDKLNDLWFPVCNWF